MHRTRYRPCDPLQLGSTSRWGRDCPRGGYGRVVVSCNQQPLKEPAFSFRILAGNNLGPGTSSGTNPPEGCTEGLALGGSARLGAIGVRVCATVEGIGGLGYNQRIG